MKLCTEAILLENGRMLHMGKPEDTVQKYYELIWNTNTSTIASAAGAEVKSPDDVTHVDLQKIAQFDHRFGCRKGEIIGFNLTDELGNRRDAFKGGMRVRFTIGVRCNRDIDMPIAGLTIKDLLGNELIKTNTDAENFFLKGFKKDRTILIAFEFIMPNLRTGSYAISAGFGNGTIDNHAAYDWIDNLTVFTIDEPANGYGLLHTQVSVSQKYISPSKRNQ
jgi:hypothetical protein